jgi:hypothetical protein
VSASTTGGAAATRRSMIVVSLLVTAAIALAAGAALAFGGDPDTTAPLAAAAGAEVEQDEDVTATVDEGTFELPVLTYEVYLARDPFDPVVPEPEAEAAETVVPTGSVEPVGTVDPLPGETDPTPVTSPTDPEPEPGTDPPPSTGGCAEGDEVVCDGLAVSLLQVLSRDGEPVAVIQVDSTIYEVRAGELFADRFMVRSIGGTCASLLYGDDGFTVCVGDRILK